MFTILFICISYWIQVQIFEHLSKIQWAFLDYEQKTPTRISISKPRFITGNFYDDLKHFKRLREQLYHHSHHLSVNSKETKAVSRESIPNANNQPTAIMKSKRFSWIGRQKLRAKVQFKKKGGIFAIHNRPAMTLLLVRVITSRNKPEKREHDC